MELKQGSLNRSPGSGDTQQIEQEIQEMKQAASQMILQYTPEEGDTITLPDSDRDMTVNLILSEDLEAVTIVLPGVHQRVGQRMFFDSNRLIATCTFTSAAMVNSAEVMFSAGDNFVYYRNQPAVISRITS